MSSRTHISQQLSAYLDGELSQAEMQRVAEALEGDAELRSELAELSATRNLLRGLALQKPAEDFAARVMAEAERFQLVGPAQADRAAHPLRWVRHLAAAAVLLMAASVGIVIALTLWSPPRADFETTALRPAQPAPAGPRSAVESRLSERAERSRRTAAEAEATADGKHGALAKADLDSDAAKAKEVSASLSPARPGEPVAAKRPAAPIEDPTRAGKAGPHSRSLAEAELGLSDALLADAGDEVIYTDRLDSTQRQVERLLTANGIAPETAAETSPAPAKAGKDIAARSRANFYYQESQRTPQQVQYVVYVTPEQATKVQQELGSLRARQNVSQAFASGAGAKLSDESAGRGKTLAADDTNDNGRQAGGEGGAGRPMKSMKMTGRLVLRPAMTTAVAPAAPAAPSAVAAPSLTPAPPAIAPAAKPAAKPDVAAESAAGPDGTATGEPKPKPVDAVPSAKPAPAAVALEPAAIRVAPEAPTTAPAAVAHCPGEADKPAEEQMRELAHAQATIPSEAPPGYREPGNEKKEKAPATAPAGKAFDNKFDKVGKIGDGGEALVVRDANGAPAARKVGQTQPAGSQPAVAATNAQQTVQVEVLDNQPRMMKPGVATLQDGLTVVSGDAATGRAGGTMQMAVPATQAAQTRQITGQTLVRVPASQAAQVVASQGANVQQKRQDGQEPARFQAAQAQQMGQIGNQLQRLRITVNFRPASQASPAATAGARTAPARTAVENQATQEARPADAKQ